MIKTIYEKCGFTVSDFKIETESKEYNACRFQLNGLQIISRNAKITPKKTGQFVTFWKRNKQGITVPFSEKDDFHFYIINVEKENRFGQFVFPKSVLKTKGIISTEIKDGKRGFRVYPIWDTVTSKQAEKTQQWQLDYFYEIGEITNIEKVKILYNKNN
ncbi:MepB family protein [Aequorivita viscosa]|nr:MepB family protein [Aequorivita viscosa]